jgi:hypothetical protein
LGAFHSCRQRARRRGAPAPPRRCSTTAGAFDRQCGWAAQASAKIGGAAAGFSRRARTSAFHRRCPAGAACPPPYLCLHECRAACTEKPARE